MNPRTRLLLMCLGSSIAIALALFLTAGTVSYWQAWAYLVVNAVASIPYVLHLLKDTRLLESRTRVGPAAERRPMQKVVVLLAALPGVSLFIVPGLDYRFGWSAVPVWLSVVGDLLIFAGMWMVYLVVKENPFGSATVEVVKDQKVISTGLYSVVRNPMYVSAFVYLVGMSLALGSYWTLIPASLTMFGLVWRLFDEEAFLANNLPGYAEYCAKVRWRLIPLVF